MNPDGLRRRIERVQDMKATASAAAGAAGVEPRPAQAAGGAAARLLDAALRDASVLERERIASMVFNMHTPTCAIDADHPCSCRAHEIADVIRSSGGG